MQKEILKALQENPRVTKEFTTYLKGIGIDVNKFLIEDSLPNKLYHFINFSTELYNIEIVIFKHGMSINKHNICVFDYYSQELKYSTRIEKLIVILIEYCEKPF